MDQKPDIPDIKPDINREDEGKGGVLAGLLSRLGLGSPGVAGLGNGAGAGLSGGILATKAGIIGLVLVGTTVAGSIGVVGYKLFGPSSSDRQDADYSSVFAVKPKTAAGSAADQGRAGSADGASTSLDYLARANAGKEQASGAHQAAEPAASAQAGASTAPPLKNDNAPGQGAAARLKTDKKFGELSKGPSAGGGGSSSSASAGAAGSAGAKGGVLAGFSGAGARPSSGGMKGLRASSRGVGAMKQLGQVYRDQKGASSSQTAGRTYDGNAQTAMAGPDAGVAGAGAGTDAAVRNPPVTPGGAGDQDRFPEPPPVEGTNVTPWQSAINTALMLVTAAGALIFLASKVAHSSPHGKVIASILVSLAALCALAVIALGAMIGGGKFGQPLQGGLLSLAGGFILATCAIAVWGGPSSLAAFDGTPGATPVLMMACGGAALAAAAVAYMSKPKSFPPDVFRDGRPPDWNHKYEAAQVVLPPSQGILDRYLA